MQQPYDDAFRFSPVAMIGAAILLGLTFPACVAGSSDTASRSGDEEGQNGGEAQQDADSSSDEPDLSPGGSSALASGGSAGGGAGGGTKATGGAPNGAGSGGASGAGGSETVTPGALDPTKLEGFGQETTGGAGGDVVYASTGTEIHEAICGRPNSDTPLIIMLSGRVHHGNTTQVSGSCETRDDAIEFKKVQNISLIGVGETALLDEIGIHLRESSNIILRNLHIRNVKKSGTPTSNGGDAIGMESGVSHVWVDHNTLEASGGEANGYDSLIDMKAGVTKVTVSYNLLRNSSRAGLVGSSDSDDANTDITFHHNWYLNIEQRTPLLRHGRAHSYNNYWSNESIGQMIHGINARMGAEILVEGNFFHNANNPLLASDDSSLPGCWQTRDNTITPEISYSRSVGDGALVIPEIVEGQLQSTCEVDVDYDYQLQPSSEVPSTVEANAGAGKLEL